jgi:cell fate regulator YaaT (PSP1 superfamily)
LNEVRGTDTIDRTGTVNSSNVNTTDGQDPGAGAARPPDGPPADGAAPGPQPSADQPDVPEPSADQPPEGQAEAEQPSADQPPEGQAEATPSPDDRPQADGPPDEPSSGSEAPASEAPAPEEARRPEPPTLVIRYGQMGLLGRFTYSLDRWRRGQRAVVKSDRGIEIGTIVCRWLEDSAEEGDLKIRGEVLRLVTHADEVEERHLEHDAEREFAFCRQCIRERNLPMKLVAVEHLFGGDRIIFYFVAEKRIDFRALVRDLAREFQTRIEMRQIGVRDEARLLGDYERCGRPLCCRAFIKNLEPVSMKMAKVQKATLDPTKISGRCGRLMCCLRFEHATYKDLARNLPRKNTEVGTAVGRGKVVATDVVSQMVGVMLESGTRVDVPVESLIPPEEAPPPGAAAQGKAGAERRPGDRGGDRPADASPKADETRHAGATPDADKDAAGGKDAGKDAGRKRRGRRGRRRSRSKRRNRDAGKGPA